MSQTLPSPCTELSQAFSINSIPANFFWDISVRFLSWEWWDFWRWHDHFRRFPKKSEDSRRSPKSSEDIRSLPKAKLSSHSLRTRINASSLPVPFTSKVRDREEGIVIYSFYTWFSFLTWVWVNIFLEIVSSKTATTHITQSGVRNWPASVSRHEIEVFNLQAWLTPKAWELAGIQFTSVMYPRRTDGKCLNKNRMHMHAFLFENIKLSWPPSDVANSRKLWF